MKRKKTKTGKIVVIEKGRIKYFIPVGSIKKSRGMAKGVSSEGLREKEDRS